ncbi:MAG: response regulator transcription factor [Mobiluncus porci]|uniref:Response regulator transcription factor n=1 Tax=Mobiluncus porci TaxID=2652278 RepID=A0A7K0K1H4_9ACTO|nr:MULTISPECIES: response regulator transcription factor [Mobiluncus]MCI6584280.1 response regulator transcription factor [Mobiluncus sp.]MDD7540719.1 response regulator transcription factor [Mobiluncus porci]MDY5748281.1 response regulator transcription factor [Mobiluncus porci]MST49346.1 response regulator transcription factor [Mobiluncus porci]
MSDGVKTTMEAGSEESVPVTVLVIDDHGLFRAGVISELGKYPEDVRVIGEASDVEGAVAAVSAAKPQVALLDVHLPGGHGGGGAEVAAAAAGGETKFLALSVSDAAEDVVAVIRAGARGYVTKTIGTAELVDAIRRVAGGDAAFSPRLAGFVLDAFGAARSEIVETDNELDSLTSREFEVMRLIARGYAYKEIASELYISVKTVESHVSAVLRKLQLSNRYELSRWASARKIV